MKIHGKKVIYQGIFLDEHSSSYLYNISSEQGVLPIIVNDLHVTFEFKPEELIPDYLLNNPIELTVIGYGNNGRVQGFLLELPYELNEFYRNEAPPHITVSRIEEAKAIETGSLEFYNIESFIVYGYFGFHIGKGVVFDKY